MLAPIDDSSLPNAIIQLLNHRLLASCKLSIRSDTTCSTGKLSYVNYSTLLYLVKKTTIDRKLLRGLWVL